MAAKDQFYFGSDTQDLLIACICRRADDFQMLGPLVKSEYMWGTSATHLYSIIQKFYEEYDHYPTFQALTDYAREAYGRDKADLFEACKEYIDKLKKVPVRDWKWVRDATVKFCRERALIVAVTVAADGIKNGKDPEGGYTKLFEEALRVGTDVTELGIAMADESDAVIDKLTSSTWGIKTGYSLLDKVWYNGWGPGWLVVPLAPPKSYKSTFCTNLALNMIRPTPGRDPVPVYYYACEISAELTAARAYSVVADLGFDDMYKNTAKFKEEVKRKLAENFLTGHPDAGQMLLKAYPAKTASISDIRQHAKNAIHTFGVRPKVIFIDHAETIKPAARVERGSDWRQQADIYTEARALGQELECVVVMPDRCNKDTVQLPVPNMGSFQGAFEKAGIVDVAIGLCQTPEERLKNYMRYFVFMNRHGRQFDYFHGSVKDNRFLMTIDDTLDYAKAQEEYEQRKEGRRKGQGGGGRQALPAELKEEQY